MVDTHQQKAPETSAPETEASGEQSRALLYGLSAGHGVKHFGQWAVLVLVPEMKAGLALSDVAVGAMFGARDAASGVANVPAGLLTDMYRHRVPLLLMISMGLVGSAYLMIGLSSWYWLTLLALMVIGAGTSLWHAPAFSELAVRYPERVGFAMAAHSTGAQVGNTTAPATIGLILGGVSFLGVEWAGLGWRTVSLLLVVPAAVTVIVIWARFKGGAPSESAVSLQAYRQASGRLLRNPAVLAQAVLHAVRGASHNSIQLFLVIYMAEELDYSDLRVGVHVSLLAVAGIASTPVLGVMSDRLGRRLVSTISMGAIAVFVLAFLWADDGWMLTVNTALLGVFIFSIMPVILASAMDATEAGSEGTSVAALFAGGTLIGAAAPVIAGAINTSSGFDGVVIFVAGLAAAGTLLSWFAPRGAATKT